jgi:antitoxin component YwqK of YwqJK toxin-antitoxin module
MKFLLGILFLSFTICAFAQDYPDNGFTNKAEAKNLKIHGKKEGKWCEYYNSSGKIIKDSATAVCYYLTVYKAGEPIGIARNYSIGGELLDEASYLNGIRNGLTKEYLAGKLEMVLPFTDGKINGVKKGYYPNGKIRFEITYVDGIESATKDYDQNGNEIK